MELLEGESLYDMMTRVRRLAPETTLTIATHAARGLARAHESNIVHRDLKPENIFLTHGEDGQTIAKLLDFGLAKFYEPTGGDAETVRLTREGALFGTPAYMSPEQAKGQGEVDHRADLWALGCIVYECLTGQTVWNVDQGVAMILAQIAGAPIPKPSRLRGDLPQNFDDWFFKALERNADKRFQTAKEFADSLAEALRPAPATTRSHSLHSEAEGVVVDELIHRSQPAIDASAPAELAAALSPAQPATKSLDVAVPIDDDAALLESEGTGTGRAIAVLLILAALALGGYGLWLYVLNPPIEQSASWGDAGLAGLNGADGGDLDQAKPQETDPYALQISAAQEWLSKGESKNALSMFKEAFNNGGSGVSRSFLAQAGAALENKGQCQVTGLARPRPFELVSPVSRPTLAVTPAGTIVSWVDNHQDERRRQGFAVVLDDALRRISPARLITPEAQSVRYPQLIAAKEKLALIYWEDSGAEPGVYVRMLEGDGRIAGAARRVSAVKRSEFYPALARAEDGTFWAVWEEEMESGADDLFACRLGTDLQPLHEPIRLTAYLSTRSARAYAGKPDIAIAHGYLYVVYAFQRGSEYRVMGLRVKLDDPVLTSGLTDDTSRRARKQDRYVGIAKPISARQGKNAQPRIACVTQGCFVVWDDETAGALAAYLDKDSGEAIWHREFANKGSRPAVATAGSRALVAYYDSSRVKIAPLGRDGLGDSDSLARVSGLQPFPAIVPGTRPGEWYISWRDYEAGHLEAFVVRAQCP
jgi:serine/threonine-protein kinase